MDMARGIGEFLSARGANRRVEAVSPPGTEIDSDENRLHMRAYKRWHSLLRGRTYPIIEDLDAETLAEFSGKSVLLDFTKGLGAPTISHLGTELGAECGVDSTITHVSQVPGESLLARLTDQYPAILAHRAPVDFEAEFVGTRGNKTLFRGLLLPFSADGATIDHIYGVISWKELGDDDIDAVLASQAEPSRPEVPPLPTPPLTLPGAPAPKKKKPIDLSWNDPFANENTAEASDTDAPESQEGVTPASGEEASANADAAAETASADATESLEGPAEAPSEALPESANETAEPPEPDEQADAPVQGPWGLPAWATSLSAGEAEADEADDDDEGLADGLTPSTLGEHLLVARQSAAAARASDVRSRAALYDALARAYDFALAAETDKAGYAALLAHAGVRAQARAPMTPVTKLVFGTDYDKARLTEFATVLTHAQRSEVPHGGLDAFLKAADGGIKGIVAAERALRRPARKPDIFDQLAEQMRNRWPLARIELPPAGSEFVLLLARAVENQSLDIIARIDDDAALIQRVVRKVAAQPE